VREKGQSYSVGHGLTFSPDPLLISAAALPKLAPINRRHQIRASTRSRFATRPIPLTSHVVEFCNYLYYLTDRETKTLAISYSLLRFPLTFKWTV